VLHLLFAFNELNYVAILFGAILYMIYGGVYYSVLLSKKRMQSAGRSKNAHQSGGSIKYIASVIVAFISSFIMYTLVHATGSDGIVDGIVDGLAIGFIVGIIIALVYLKNTLFGLIKNKSFLIAIGDHLIIFTLLGGLHGLMM